MSVFENAIQGTLAVNFDLPLVLGLSLTSGTSTGNTQSTDAASQVGGCATLDLDVDVNLQAQGAILDFFSIDEGAPILSHDFNLFNVRKLCLMLLRFYAD